MRCGAAGLGLGLEARGALARELARRAVVRDDAHVLARLGDGVEAEHLDRLGGRRLLDLAAAIVVQRAHAAPVGARDDRVADLERAAVDEHGHDRAAARVELGLDDHARRLGVRVGLELLDLGQQQDRLQQLVEVGPGLRGDVHEHRLAAPLLRLEAELRHLRAHAVGLRALLVDLVDRDEDRHLGRLRVVDRLARLRLHAVVGRHHDHRDVGDLGAAGAHRREGLVARRVEEGDDLVAGRVDLVGADVLGDAAGLARGHLGLADRVEQRRLAVIDVAHDRDHGRAGLEVLGVVVEGRLRVLLVGDVDDLDLLVELVGEDLDRVVGQRLGERGHLPQLHQLLDDLGDRDAQVLGDVLDRRAGVDLDDVGLQDADVLRHRLRVGAAPAPAAAPRRAPRRAATGAARAAAGTAGPPPWRREACESMTTRRTPPAEPGARSPCSEERVGRRGPSLRRSPLPRPSGCCRRRPAWPRAGAWASASCPRAGGRRGRGCRDRRPGAAACAAAASAWRRWWAPSCRSAPRRPGSRPPPMQPPSPRCRRRSAAS